MPHVLNIEIARAEGLKSGSLFSGVKSTRVEVALFDDVGSKWWPVGASDEGGKGGSSAKDPTYSSKLPPATLRAESMMRFQVLYVP